MQVNRSNILRKGTLVVGAALALVLLPTVAAAIPGSGDFTALYSPGGREITELWNIIGKICLAVLIIVEVVLILAIILFRRKDDTMPKQSHGYLPLEIGWTAAAAAVQIFIGVKTIDVMFEVEVMPETEMTVEAIAFQWGWQFRYPDHGNLLSDDLVFPAHTNVKLEVTSRDVIHSIFVPELGVKIDAVPGRFNYWWFNADGPINQVLVDEKRTGVERDALPTTRPQIVGDWYANFKEPGRAAVTGLEDRVTYLADSRAVEEVSPYAKYSAVEYRGMCTELCGKGHYDMYFRAVAMTRTSFEQWLEDQRTGDTGPVDGAEIYASKCATCHGADGAGVPPQFPPLAGAKWTTQEDMKTAHVEVVLLGSQASTLTGDTEIAGQTYKGVMQAWNEVFNDEEVAAVVNHERTSWGNSGGEVTAEEVAQIRADLGLAPFPAGGAEPIPEGELMALGERVWATCASCHGAEGKGAANVPDIAGNPTVLGDIPATVGSLVVGQDTDRWPGFHSPMGKSMTDLELAAIVTYIRRSFGNEASPVMPDEIARIRQEIAP